MQIEWGAGNLNSKMPAFTGSVSIENPTQVAHSQGLYFDLASLTKVIATSTCLVENYLKSKKSWAQFVDQPLSNVVTELKGSELENLSLRHFWEHRSGLQAHTLVFGPKRQQFENRSEAWRQAIAAILKTPVDIKRGTIYSDLGYLLLGLWLERSENAFMLDLWSAWRKKNLPGSELKYFSELSMNERARVQPTETGRHPIGQVNDDNAFGLGEASSHAGLTGRVQDVWQWMTAILAWNQNEKRLNSWIRDERLPNERFIYGWDTATPSLITGRTQAGMGAPRLTRGFLGYTGTALWFDPESALGGVLLTNRVFPIHNAQSQIKIADLRTEFFTALWQNEDLGRGLWLHS